MLVRKTHPQSRVVLITLFLATVLQLTTAQGDSHDFSRMILAVLYVFVHAYTPAQCLHLNVDLYATVLQICTCDSPFQPKLTQFSYTVQ